MVRRLCLLFLMLALAFTLSAAPLAAQDAPEAVDAWSWRPAIDTDIVLMCCFYLTMQVEITANSTYTRCTDIQYRPGATGTWANTTAGHWMAYDQWGGIDPAQGPYSHFWHTKAIAYVYAFLDGDDVESISRWRAFCSEFTP